MAKKTKILIDAKQKKAEVQPMKRSDVPVGAKIISVLYYIGAIACLLLGLLLFVAAGFADTIANATAELSGLGGVIATLGVVGGVVMIAGAALFFFIGRGLWKGQAWARIVAIIFALLGIISAVNAFAQGVVLEGIFNLIVGGVIGCYLLFDNEVKAAFA